MPGSGAVFPSGPCLAVDVPFAEAGRDGIGILTAIQHRVDIDRVFAQSIENRKRKPFRDRAEKATVPFMDTGVL
jgi:hypothetical protein